MTESSDVNSDVTLITVELDVLLDEVRLCIDKCQAYHRIPGISKLERKFRAEERFLKRVCTYIS
jgi:hypothetical protein